MAGNQLGKTLAGAAEVSQRQRNTLAAGHVVTQAVELLEPLVPVDVLQLVQLAADRTKSQIKT